MKNEGERGPAPNMDKQVFFFSDALNGAFLIFEKQNTTSQSELLFEVFTVNFILYIWNSPKKIGGAVFHKLCNVS